MEIIYLISVIILLISFILMKKTEKEINIISFICISIVTLFCYNTFVCYILTFFTIPITLWLLSLINIFISALFITSIIKNKEVQKYNFNKIDILYIAIILLIILAIAYVNFGFPFNINFETGDPSLHYLTSVMFAESDSLLAAGPKDEVYGGLTTRKTVSYVNSGLLMKCFCPNLDPIECYDVFVLFGIFTCFLIGATMYSALTNLSKNKEHRLWALVVASICMLGYPLNSLLFGFEYLSMGMLVICAIIDLVFYYENEIIDIKFVVILMALLNFGLFSSYFMFVPFMYPALWINFCIHNYYKTNKIVTKRLMILLSVTLLIPFILGYLYHLAPQIYSIFINDGVIEKPLKYSSHIVNSSFKLDGYIYINLYSNMIPLLLLTIYSFIRAAKYKKFKNDAFIGLAILLNIAFIVLLLILNKFGKVSMYYLSKNYFSLWILLIYYNYKVLVELSNKKTILPRLCITIYVFIMIIYTIFTNVKMINALNNPYENIFTVMEIFGVNKDILVNKPIVYNREELEILRYARNNLDYNKKIEIVSDDYVWTYVLLRYINNEPSFEGKKYGEDYLTSKWLLLPKNIKKADYIIYFNESSAYEYFENTLFKNSEIIFRNETGGILKYKK